MCAAQLFDHIASSIARFVREENVPSATPERPLPLGFSFSFPMSQESLQSGLLLTWTKTFRNTSGVGEDAVQLLQKAIKKRHVRRAAPSFHFCFLFPFLCEHM